MKKLLLLLFITPVLVLNARQQQNHNTKSEAISLDSIFVTKADTSYSTFNNPLQFTSFIQVKVHGLSKLLMLSTDLNKPIHLFLDGIEMKGIKPIGIDNRKGVLFFILHRDSITMKQWQIVRRIVLEKKKKELSVSVGLKGMYAYPTTLSLPAELSRTGDYFLAILSYAFSIIMFSFLIKRSNILRRSRQQSNDTYSLSKSLIAFWIFIILFSILYLLSAINSMPQISTTVFILLAFSVITSLIAKTIDSYINPHSEKIDLALKTDFLTNIISDPQGFSIYRLQLVLFTLLTGSYFIISVISEMLLPVFDKYFIAIYGISLIVYLTFKCFEKNGRSIMPVAQEA